MSDAPLLKDSADAGGSRIGSVSVRGLMALVLVVAVCVLAAGELALVAWCIAGGVTPPTPLLIVAVTNLASLATGFYFGQKNHQKPDA